MVYGLTVEASCIAVSNTQGWEKTNTHKKQPANKYQIGDSDYAGHEKARVGKLGHLHTLPESPVESLRPGDVAEQAELARAPMPVQDFQGIFHMR